jgi:hypothetical protein
VRDVDLLVVHENIEQRSCRLAISCKREFIRVVSNAHVTLLSKPEESQLHFVASSQAKFLGTINERSICSDILALCREFGLGYATKKCAGEYLRFRH